MNITIDDKVSMAGAVWTGILLSNLDELRELKEDERIETMAIIFAAIKAVMPDTDIEKILQDSDKIAARTAEVYAVLENMKVMKL